MKLTLRIALGALLASTALTEPAQAFPIFGAIAGFIGLTGFAATVVATTLEIGAAIGLSYLAKALAPKPQTPELQNLPGGTSGKLQSGGAVPRSFIVGRYATAGSLVYANTYSAGAAQVTAQTLIAEGFPPWAAGAINAIQASGNTPNAYLVQVIALSDLPVTALRGLVVNGAVVTYDASGNYAVEGIPIPQYNVSGTDYLWVRFYDGTQTAVDPQLFALFGTDPDRPYGNDRIGHGVAYAVVTARVNSELFTGFPQCKFIIDGVKLYDRRQDSSAGGVGSQRLTDPTTWTLTTNPAVITENVLRGIAYNGTWLYGAQTVSTAQLPSASWMAAANECDVSIGLAAGGTELQFIAGGEISVDKQPADTLDELLKSCNGRLAEIGGTYKLRCGAAGAAVFSFTDDDILSTDQQTFDPFPSLQKTVNAVTAKYVSPDEAWNTKDAAPLYDATLEAADGGRRQPVDVQYSFVTSGTQVQRLMKSERDTQRAFRRHTLPMPPDAFVLEPLDVVSWTSTRNGYSAKTFDIISMDDLPNLNVGLSIQELDPNAYDWTPATDEQPVSNGTIVILRPAAQPVVDWSVEPWTVLSDFDQKTAAIKLNWDPNTDDVDGIRYEVRLQSNQEVILRGSYSDRIKAGSLIISQNIIANTNYEVRAQYVPISERETSWSSWLAVLTPDVPVEFTSFAANIRSLIQDLVSQVNAVESKIQDVARLASETDANSLIQRAAERGTLKSRTDEFRAGIGANSASIVTLQEVIGDPDVSLAVFETTTTATLDGHTASINSNTTAISTIDGKLAASFGVTLTVDGYASGFYNYNTGVGGSAFIVSSDFFQVATAGKTPKAVFTLGTIGGAAALGLSGNVFLDGTITATMMNVGSLTAITANFGTATVTGRISSPGGDLVIDFNADSITMPDGTITTGKLVVNSVTDFWAANQGAAVAFTGVPQTSTIVSTTIAPSFGRLEIHGELSAALDATTDGDHPETGTYTVSLLIDGAAVGVPRVINPVVTFVDQLGPTFRTGIMGSVHVMAQVNVTAASHTVALQFASTSTGSGNVTGGMLIIRDNKR